MAEFNGEKFLGMLKNNSKRLAFVAVMLTVVCGLSGILYLKTNIARVSDDEKSVALLTTSRGEATLLSEAGIEAGENDKLLYTSFSGNYIDITVKGGYGVTVTADGAENTVTVNESTVGEALAAAGIELGEDDYTDPSIHTILTADDDITVHRVEYISNSYEQTITHDTTYKQSSLLYKKKYKSYTLSDGEDGYETLTYRERYVDGEMTQQLISSIVVDKEPVDAVVLTYGAGVPVSDVEAPRGVTVTNGVPSGYSRVLSMSATGYYASKGRGASGLGLYYGTVAVNPSVIAYGTKMYIASADGQFVYGWAIATDTGAAMTANPSRIDLFYETYTESLLNGRIQVNVYVYG